MRLRLAQVLREIPRIRYTTDYRGRPISVSGTPLKSRGAADPALRRAIGTGPDAADGDVGFHLFAESFGDRLNTVPGNGKVPRENFEAFKNLNSSEYAKMENQVCAALKDPNIKDMSLTVEPVYLTTSADWVRSRLRLRGMAQRSLSISVISP